MKQVAIIEVSGPDEQPIEPKIIQAFGAINPDTFVAHWNNYTGVAYKAQQDWETFCNALFTALIDAELLTADGFDIEGYDFGSFNRLFLDNIKHMPPKWTDHFILKTVIIPALKKYRGMAASKKGREIKVNMDKVAETLHPIGQIISDRMMANPQRAVLGESIKKLAVQFSKSEEE